MLIVSVIFLSWNGFSEFLEIRDTKNARIIYAHTYFERNRWIFKNNWTYTNVQSLKFLILFVSIIFVIYIENLIQ